LFIELVIKILLLILVLKWVALGMHYEGLYRVAGFHDHIEEIRKAFDLGEKFILWSYLVVQVFN